MDEQKQADGNDSGLTWAIVDSGTRRLVGMILRGVATGEVVEVTQAVELESSVTRLPAGPQGQLAHLAAPIMVPVDSEETPVAITVLAHNIRYFEYMADKGQRYEMMYNSLQAQLLQMRARRLNIEPAHEMPRGGPGFGMGPGMGGGFVGK